MDLSQEISNQLNSWAAKDVLVTSQEVINSDFYQAIQIETELEAGDSNLTPEAQILLANIIANSTSLTVLYIYSNAIGDKGAVALAGMLKENNTIECINLSRNEIGDKGAAALAGMLRENKTLISLNLCMNKIEDQGILFIADSLIYNKTLISLNFNMNKIGDKGAAALAVVLRENNTLTSLNLYMNKIGDKGAAALADALIENNTLTSIYLHAEGDGEYTFKDMMREEMDLYIERNKTIFKDTSEVINEAIKACLNLDDVETLVIQYLGENNGGIYSSDFPDLVRPESVDLSGVYDEIDLYNGLVY
jgi:Ran GTPase-activating protein (RanGAP) involved in mRNA processing and transport